MEGSRRQNQQPDDANDPSRGRFADKPTEIPKKGWRDILLRVKDNISEDNLSMIAGGTAFFILLALVPGLSALISIYGLIANPSDIQTQFDAMARLMPGDVRTLLEGQMTRIAGQHQAAGFAAVVSIVLALWGGAAGMKTIMNALTMINHEEEKRSYIKLTLAALGLTLVYIVVGIVAIGLIVALPPLLGHLGITEAAKTTGSIIRWPILLILALIGVAILYRYGPSREEPKWRWVSPGAIVATVLWVLASGLFAAYAQHFGNYNKTYGSLGAIIVLMTWMYISAFVLLLGAEINAEAEHQTKRDSTTGPPKPMGHRGAYVADTVGKRK